MHDDNYVNVYDTQMPREKSLVKKIFRLIELCQHKFYKILK